MVSYDPEVQYEFANRLYRRANQIIAVAVVIGLLVGGVAGYAAEATVGTITIIGVVLGGAIGYVWGTQRAFILKLQAQTALCQVRIEENTRQE